MPFYYLSAFSAQFEPTSAAVDFCNNFIAAYSSRDFNVWTDTKLVLYFPPLGEGHTTVSSTSGAQPLSSAYMLPFYGFGGFSPDKPSYFIKTLVVNEHVVRPVSAAYIGGPYDGMPWWTGPLFDGSELYIISEYVALSTMYTLLSDGSDFLPISAMPVS